MTAKFPDPMSAEAAAREPSDAMSGLRGRLASPLWQRSGKEIALALALVLTLAAPWVLKPKDSTAPRRYDRRIVIITPHHEKIRAEFGAAFARHWKAKTGETLYVDWRMPGGTAEIAMFLKSEYLAAFQNHWTRDLKRPWTGEVAAACLNPKVAVPKGPAEGLTLAQEARKAFLESNVGVKTDLFFGGGSFDFEQQAKLGIIVPASHDGKYGLAPLMARRAEWFREDVLPQQLSGELFYDPERRWVGSCLSNMGIVYNKDVLRRLGIEKEPAQWADLGDARYLGQIALSDPNKSGTVAKALEQLIQQQMQQAIDELRAVAKKDPKAFRNEEELVKQGLGQGWKRGLQLIQRICANARYFTDSSTKIPMEVAQGDSAAGLCIDFYGRSLEEQVRKGDGTTRVAFVTPVGGSSVGVDPVALLRGAPEPMVADAFMEFVLSDAGQKLWNCKPGLAGGPADHALRRLPVRHDIYTDANRGWMSDRDARPYEDAKAFTYHPEWTAKLFNVIRFLVKVMCIEVHDEQRSAWAMLKSRDFPKHALESFQDVEHVGYERAQRLADDLAKNGKKYELGQVRELTQQFRSNYQKAREQARRGY